MLVLHAMSMNFVENNKKRKSVFVIAIKNALLLIEGVHLPDAKLALSGTQLQLDAIASFRRFSSAERAALSITTASPFSLTEEVARTPDLSVASEVRARWQFSALALAICSSAALRLAASSASFFLFSAVCWPGADAAPEAATAAAEARARGARGFVSVLLLPTSTTAVGEDPPGCLMMFLAGIFAGGAVSLNVMRPELSRHCHCAKLPVLMPSKTDAANTLQVMLVYGDIRIPL